MPQQHPILFQYPIRLRHKSTGKYLYTADVRTRHQNSAGQQIVSIADTKEAFATWVFKHGNNSESAPGIGYAFSTNDLVRVENLAFHKNLHSHEGYRSPITRQNEVTVFGNLGVGDPNDDWELNILSVDDSGSTAEIVLRHVPTKRYLHANNQMIGTPPVAGSSEVCATPDKNNDSIWVVEPTGEQAMPLSAITTVIEIPERHIAERFTTSTTLTKWTEAITKWVNTEASRWEWLQQTLQKLPDIERRSLNDVHKKYHDAFQTIRAAIQTVVSNLDATGFESTLASLSNQIQAVYERKSGILYSNEPAGIFSLSQSGQHTARPIVILGILSGQNPTIQTAEAARGVTDAIAFLEGKHPETNDAFAKSVEELRNSWQESTSETIAVVHRDVQVAEAQLRALGEKARALDERADKLIAEKTASIAALEQTLSKKVALDNSVVYWENRAKQSLTKAKWFGVAAALGIIITVGVVAYQSSKLFGPSTPAPLTEDERIALLLTKQQIAAKEPEVTKKAEGDPAHQYWRYLLVGVTLTFGVWVSRVLVKITMSNLHVSTDAEERVTMLKTFLSLMSDQSIHRQEDIKLILQTVFRPGTTGLVDEDSGIQTPLELVLRNISGDGKK